ncbi:thioredoxin domain-containing protein [Niabella aurantiaca]|uniref:thioredoxin domain-containing protein n=1 Tax=Niabella aurantiaca TaxID=379900 RepID=UPI0003652782|nr:thioredoxin domain-containing protein [Niabella aurantiaca]
MKYLLFAIVGTALFFSTYGQTAALPVQTFYNKIEDNSSRTLLDVRTPKEYHAGHVAGAININWNDSSFASRARLLPKDQPVYLYCLSGGRSAKAADFLRKKGFKKVYEMAGGMMKWRADGLPEERSAAVNDAFVRADFDKALVTDKLVLVDFYAEWCAPCKKMEPYLKEIAREKAATVTVLRINVDESRELARELRIDALPVLHLYKNGKLQWSTLGYIRKEKVLAKLK